MIGKIRIKLASLIEFEINKKLNSNNITVDPHDLLSQNNGGSLFVDWAKWRCTIKQGGCHREIYGHSTMTECAKNGIDISIEQRDIEITAKAIKLHHH